MKFSYSSVVAKSPDGDDFFLFRRPEIPITIFGENGSATYVALVDTGSDNTIFPASVARYLGIAIDREAGPMARSFAGHQIELLSGDAVLEIESDNDRLRWHSPICFFDFDSPDEEAVVLGHAGFLEFFTATFDGKGGILTLQVNDELPAIYD